MAMTLVSTTTVPSGGAASIEFTNIPQTGKDLLILISAQSESGFGVRVDEITLNSDTGGNYSSRKIEGNGSSVSSGSQSSAFAFEVTAIAEDGSNNSIYISNYTSSAAKSISFDSVTEKNTTEAYQFLAAGSYATSSPITSIKFDTAGDYAQHSTASLYIIS